MAKKSAPNPHKLIRMPCPSCGKPQDIWRENCSHCKAAILEDGERESLRDKVDALEEAVKATTFKTNQGNPYKPFDDAFALVKKLEPHANVEGMKPWLQSVKDRLREPHLKLHRATVRANVIAMMAFIVIAVLPQLVGWSPMVSLILALPAAFWLGVTIKAYMDLNKAKRT